MAVWSCPRWPGRRRGGGLHPEPQACLDIGRYSDGAQTAMAGQAGQAGQPCPGWTGGRRGGGLHPEHKVPGQARVAALAERVDPFLEPSERSRTQTNSFFCYTLHECMYIYIHRASTRQTGGKHSVLTTLTTATATATATAASSRRVQQSGRRRARFSARTNAQQIFLSFTASFKMRLWVGLSFVPCNHGNEMKRPHESDGTSLTQRYNTLYIYSLYCCCM